MSQFDQNNPFVTMAELWTQSAKVYTQAVQTFVDAASEAANNGQAGVQGDPVGAAQAYTQQWVDAAMRLSTLQPQFFEALFNDLPRKASARINAQTFSQLGRMATARWEEDLRRLSEMPFAFMGRFADTDTDTERIGGLVQSMVAEYVKDLELFNGANLAFNMEPLTSAMERFFSGGGAVDEQSSKIVERLIKTTITKLQYGNEFYADPDETPVGLSPREAIHGAGTATLYRYLPPKDAPERSGDPVLLVYSIINKPYILDLTPGYSFIEHLLSEGLDVYLIDWGASEPGDRTTTLDSYIDPVLRSCVDVVKARTGADKVSLFGHCIGGNLALLYASLFPDDVARVLTLTTPISSAKGGVVALWTDRDLFPVDAIVETFGHMPAKLIRYTFMALKPYYEVLKWKNYYEQIHNDDVVKFFHLVDRWANDNVDLPGEVFRKFVVEVLHQDRFRNGETRINGRVADLKAVTCPLYNLAASKDWIVPHESAQLLGDYVGSEEKYYSLIEGAHVAIMIEPGAHHHWTDMSNFMLGKAPKQDVS